MGSYPLSKSTHCLDNPLSRSFSPGKPPNPSDLKGAPVHQGHCAASSVPLTRLVTSAVCCNTRFSFCSRRWHVTRLKWESHRKLLLALKFFSLALYQLWHLSTVILAATNTSASRKSHKLLVDKIRPICVSAPEQFYTVLAPFHTTPVNSSRSLSRQYT